MQLILEENDAERRFKLNDGKLTVGTAESCTLTVQSDDVAEVHLELHVEGGEVTVVPRKGVAPVKVGGVALKAPRKIKTGQLVKFGSASLHTESPGAKKKVPGVTKRAGSGEGGTKATVQRRARQPQGKSLPTWAILLIAVPVILVGYKLFVSFGEGTSDRAFSAQTSQIRITEALKNGDYKTAEDEFKKVDAQADLSTEWKTAFEGLRAKLKDRNTAGSARGQNIIGSKYLDSQIKGYQSKYLTKNGRPEARVFVRRAQYFLDRWPDHPEREYVTRMMNQFSEVGRMSEPSSLADVTWEAKTLTWAFPRNYKAAFKVLNDFIAAAPADEAKVAEGLIATYKLEQKSYFDERLDLAAGLYVDNNKSKALEFCLQLVIGVDDQEMEDDAARRITEMAGVEKALTGLKRDRRNDFDALAQNSILKSFFKKQGLL